ncbi:ribonuclease J [Patescibacteria group bacterium]
MNYQNNNNFNKTNNNYKPISEIDKSKLKFIPLGGLGEIGKNMAVLEYEDDILIIDCGMMFPRKEMLGVDFVIPNIKYLEDNKHKIRGMVVTHGHEDHIGAIPYLAPLLGMPIYATRLTKGFIDVKLKEFNISKIEVHKINIQDKLKFGVFEVEPFQTTHSFPDSIGLIIKTPVGNLVWLTDFKIDRTPIDSRFFDLPILEKASKDGVLALFSDSTRADTPGSTISEKEIGITFEKIIKESNGRVIVTSFASLLHRIQLVINAAQKNRRKVAISGRSMVNNIEMAIRLGYLNVPKNTIIDIRRANKMNDRELVILCTGSQGQELSALVRMARGEHKQIQVKRGDTVVISASPIPGNEEAVQDTINDLFRRGAHVIFGRNVDIHVSGHAYKDELQHIMKLIKPKYFVPIHGEYHHLVIHSNLAKDVGIAEKNIGIVENGRVLEMDSNQLYPLKRRVPAGYVLVDGLGIGDVGNIVLRDRKAMASAGIVVAIVTVDKEGNLLTSPDIISRGFIYMREAEELVHKMRNEIKNQVHKYYRQYRGDLSTMKNLMRDDLTKFIYNETKREPMVLPVIIELKR